KLAWPSTLVVAKAYIDQLERSQALPAKQISDLRKSIASAESSHMNKGKVAKLNKLAPSVEKNADSAKTPADASRMRALATILAHPSAS
ncbi:MAG TPA: hypothetical protein VMH31_03050, partial [Methylomirabilota bacterium]|nr:hypothetical protein [Methylomirabilota bacterium]